MANKTLFRSIVGKLLPKTNAVNAACGHAYKLDDRHALAQFAATGCLNSTFYASAASQLADVLKLAGRVEPEFVARTALYARKRAYMKDMPALLCAVLSVRSPGLLAEVFDRVIDNPKMLRNFVQIMRSGVVGRKSLGSLPKRLILQWLAARSDRQIFTGSVGASPSLADIVKMVHPKPANASRESLYGYLLGRDYNAEMLPGIVSDYERFKRSDDRNGLAAPDVPFQMLTSLELNKRHWIGIAENASWQMTRMNLNTFLRHGVLDKRKMVRLIAKRLADPELIAKARVLPYQLMTAYMCASTELPSKIRYALQDAMEIALANVPAVDGKVYVFPDVSGSMYSPVTGHRKGSTTAVRCIDVAALVSAAMLRTNRDAEVIPFESNVVKVALNPRDSVMTNAQKLSSLPCGGTNCSAPLRYLNARKAEGDLLIYVSDNESWLDSPHYGHFGGSATATMQEWSVFKRRNPQAKLICIDIQPYDATQVAERDDIINVAGFSDKVFSLIADVATGETKAGYWVRQIEEVKL
ncbi:MAG: TROVE domain-containing protein [bacterium]|nr:TROVE domain-containing protein [bacterium]